MIYSLLIFLRSMVPGVLLIVLQQIVAVYTGGVVLIPDVLLVFILIHILFSTDDKNDFFFINVFILGVLREVWSYNLIGVLPLFYVCLAFPYRFIQNIFPHNVLMVFIMLLVFLYKCILYITVGYVFSVPALLAFSLSLAIVWECVSTILIMLIIYCIKNFFSQRKIN